MGNLNVYTSFNKFPSNCSLCLKCPKTQIWHPLLNWKFGPSPHSDPIISTHTYKTRHHFNCRIQAKLSVMLRLHVDSQKKHIQTESSFWKVGLLLEKPDTFFPGLESFDLLPLTGLKLGTTIWKWHAPICCHGKCTHCVINSTWMTSLILLIIYEKNCTVWLI